MSYSINRNNFLQELQERFLRSATSKRNDFRIDLANSEPQSNWKKLTVVVANATLEMLDNKSGSFSDAANKEIEDLKALLVEEFGKVKTKRIDLAVEDLKSIANQMKNEMIPPLRTSLRKVKGTSPDKPRKDGLALS